MKKIFFFLFTASAFTSIAQKTIHYYQEFTTGKNLKQKKKIQE